MDELKRKQAEVEYLLARCGCAGSVRFHDDERWTGMSSNAVVAFAFGGKQDAMPHDAHDLAACYRAVMRMPQHLIPKASPALRDAEAALANGRYGYKGVDAAKEMSGFDWALLTGEST